MKTVFSLREDKTGLWCICIGQVTLFSQLQLAAAIRLARTLARDEHHRSGRHVTVELPGPDSAIELAHYRHSPEAA